MQIKNIFKNLSLHFQESDSETETSPDPSTTTIMSGFEKRHIGAMARSGWIPSFRPTLNRFSRSGRTSNMEKIVKIPVKLHFCLYVVDYIDKVQDYLICRLMCRLSSVRKKGKNQLDFPVHQVNLMFEKFHNPRQTFFWKLLRRLQLAS